ncbi:F-BAR and double SH3 domains protein 2-like isoform X2 [Babylonia areolata]|uniref:F-BAR and double SH3 domains protein 2-like isoform X2 n=1 Tax=Babylonia areolata TaxID=304850 RepID=UPI003FCF94D3
MNPPPRKVKPAVALKNIHAEQTAKLQAKHQQECDILEDIRTFFRQKAALEKEYAQGLQKVTTQLLKKEFPAQPDVASDDGLEHRTVVTVWRHLLEESDRQAKARLQAAEIYADKIAEPIKGVKSTKQQCTKKVMPQLTVLHGEVTNTVMEMVKAHKAYTLEESTAHEARQKVSEAEDKIKRKSTGLFQSMSGLQKTCTKLRSRKEACDAKSTAARNEYLLAMAGANAHQIRFYSTDLPDLMKTLDCDIYERVQEYLTLASSTAADISKLEATTFATIAGEAEKISRQFSLQCYLFQNQVFTNLVQYHFDPCHNDECNKVSGDNGATPELEKEARKCATKIAKETKLIRDYYRALTQLQSRCTDRMSESSQDDKDKGDPKANGGGSTSSSSVDPEQKMDDIRQNIRKAETAKMKAEARLEALRAAGVNVEEWLNQAQMDSLTADENGMQRTPSQMSLRTESSGGHSADDQEPTYTHYDDDDDDFIDDTFTSSATSRFGRPFPIACKALYDFEASNYDELSIKQREALTLIAAGDGEGWVKAKNSLGQSGYIPENYVDLSEADNTNTNTTMSMSASASDVETIQASGTDRDITPTSPTTPMSPPAMAAAPLQSTSSMPQSPSTTTTAPSTSELQSPPGGEVPPDTTSSYSSGDLEVQQATDDMIDENVFPPPPPLSSVGITWARALYDYEAQTQEELSFMEGALIKIIGKDSGVDDGYWEGELNGRCGVFPSLVVEELMDSNDDQDVLMPLSNNDYGAPPPVTVTMPTPDDEPPPPPPICQNGGDWAYYGSPYKTTKKALEFSSNDQVYVLNRYNNYKKVRFSNEEVHHAGNLALAQDYAEDWDSECGEESFV